MKIKQIYIYPVKSLRGLPLPAARVVNTGFQHDRTFMLLQVMDGSSKPRKLKNMHVTHFHQMSLFKTAILLPEDGKEEGRERLTVTYAGPAGSLPPKTISIPLVPDTDGLATFEVMMHKSPTEAYEVGAEYNDWFSEQFGFEVVLAYIGPMRRKILGSGLPSANDSTAMSAARSLSRLLSSYLPSGAAAKEQSPGITFSDCAMFLVVTEESLADTSSRLPEGVEMDVRKFRPNIVLCGAEEPWSEDLWGGIQIENGTGVGVEIALTMNCIRCVSINIDYATGQPSVGEEGTMLKKLMSDRRVDKGAKYSPVFGRYGYLGKGFGSTVSIGDDVSVVRKLDETTIFDWPGLTN